MDLETGLICVGVVVASAVVLYLISMITIKEKTYEEAIAEQRSMPEENLLLGRSTKDKNKEKKLKKAGKKVKEKSLQKDKNGQSDPVVKGSAGQKVHVDFGKPEAEVVTEQPPQDDKKKKKKEKVKPILLNKTEKSLVVDTPIAPINHFEEILPKDDLLLKLKGSREDLRENAEKVVTKGQETQSQETPKITSVSVKAVTAVKNEKLASQKAEKIKRNEENSKTSKEKGDLSKSDKPSSSKLDKVVGTKTEDKKSLKSDEKIPAAKIEKQTAKNEKTVSKAEDKIVSSKPEEKKHSKEEKVVLPVSEPKQSGKFERQQVVKAEVKGPMVSKNDTKLDAEKDAENKDVSLKSDRQVVQNILPDAAVPPQKKKKKSELATLQQMNGENENVNVTLLMSLLRKAELSRTEVQGMIDLLLNKQQGSGAINSEWIEGRQDPVVKLKKQLAEKEKALAEEQEASQAFQNKLKELRSEYNSERSRLSHSCRQLEEALVAKQNETQSLASRLQHTHDSLVAEKQQLSQQLQQLQAKVNEERLLLRKVQEEQAQNQGVQEQLLNQRQQLEIHINHLTEQHQESDSTLKSQIAQLHAQLQEGANVNAELQSQCDEQIAENKMLQEHTSRLETQIVHLEQQLAHFKEAADHVQDLTRQLEESRIINAEVEHSLNISQQREAELQYEVNKTKDSFDNLNSKYVSLLEVNNEASQLRTENEKLVGQLAVLKDAKLESQRFQEENEHLKKQISVLSGLEREAQQLREENETLAAQVTAVTERPAAEGRENGDTAYCEENQAFIKNEQLTRGDLLTQNTMLDKLSSELMEKTSLLERLNLEICDYKTDISRLNEELEHQKIKNDKTVDEIQSEQQAAVRILLKRIFPSIRIDESEVQERWLERFEKEACSLISQLQRQKQELDINLESSNRSTMLVELEKQNSQLTALVAHYKTIIDDTEGMLNKLQNHVEQEEARWQQQLQQKENELELLQEERDKLLAAQEHAAGAEEMQTKLQDLQTKLETEQQEKQKLISALNTAHANCSVLRTEIEKHENSKATLQMLQEEKALLCAELQTERERFQEASAELIKVKGFVKTGKESSFHEHERVADLQQKGDRLNGVSDDYASASNGPSSETSLHEGGSGKK